MNLLIELWSNFKTCWNQRKFGRYISKDGYVDSNQTIHRANLNQVRLERTKRRSNSVDLGKSSRQPRIELSSVDVAKMEPERRKHHEKHLKVIEDQMIQSKQVERALKRKEGDVKKEQRQIRQTVREFDASNYKNHYRIN
mgnify:CR=1 FL=1